MRAASWFAGIGGFDLALRRAGHEVVGACEIDPFARKVYAARFVVPPWFRSDINEVVPDAIPEADLWCGGFPCQDLSVAGKRDGFSGARSGIVWRWLDLAAGCRPRWILMENVPGMLSVDGGAGFGALIARLDELGYVGAWACLDARHFGVPQRRRRIFILACRAGIGDPGAVLALTESRGGHSAAGGTTREDVAGTLGGCTPGAGGRWGGDEAAAGHVVVVNALRAGRGGGCGPDDNDAQGGRLIVTDAYRIRRLTPTEYERLQGLPDGWTCGCGVQPYSTAACRCPDGPRYRALGNAVAVPVVEWIVRRL